jgi:hypothetical protein
VLFLVALPWLLCVVVFLLHKVAGESAVVGILGGMAYIGMGLSGLAAGLLLLFTISSAIMTLIEIKRNRDVRGGRRVLIASLISISSLAVHSWYVTRFFT